jgi:Cyanate permease
MGNIYIRLFLLWLAGTGLRLTILAPPPVISMINTDLNLSATQIGLLAAIPAVLFACAAVPGSLLIARVGALPAVTIGLLVTAVGSALRGVAPNITFLYGATVVTGLGVAVMQPSMPSLVRAWLPNKMSLATAVYVNGLIIGEVMPVALTVPLVLPLVRSWRLDFAVWGAICAVIALIIFSLAPKRGATKITTPRKWWPDWNSSIIWKLGIMIGSVNATYFSTNYFIPLYLQETGHGNTTTAALIALNIGQIPASVLLLFIGRNLERRAWPYVSCGVICLVAILSIVFGNSLMVICGAGLVGYAAATVLILMLGLPPLLSPPEDVHRTAAAMLTIGYSCAVVIPIFSGIFWDFTGVPAMAFLPIAICAFVLIVLAFTTRTSLTNKLINLDL